MALRAPWCSWKLSEIRAIRFGPMPGISVRRSGCSPSTVSVSSPNSRTMSTAVAGPIPRISPLPRYRSMPSSVVGAWISQETHLNCFP